MLTLEESIHIYVVTRTEKQIFHLKNLCLEWQQQKESFWTFDEILKSLLRPSYIGYFAAKSDESDWKAFILVDIGPFSADVMYIYVRPETRGRGFGMELLNRVQAGLREFPQVESLFLEVRISNQRAIDLYEKFGMKQVGLRKQYYRNGEDAYVYMKKLQG